MNTIKLTGGKPAWLESWPDMAALNFPIAMRSLAFRILSSEDNLTLNLTDKSLTAIIGVHRCVWTHLPDGTWKRSCTCKYPNDKCVHAYASYLMLKQACIDMEWNFPAGNTVNKPVQSTSGISWNNLPPRQPIQHQAPSFRPQFNQQSSQTTFLNRLNGSPLNRAPVATSRPQINNASPVQQSQRPLVPEPAKLEVEVEFVPNTQGMYVRFYIFQHEYRRLLDIPKIRYTASLANEDATSGKRLSEYIWSQEDKDFLIWLLPQLRARGLNARSSNSLWLPLADKEEWLEKWGAVAGRLIEKSTQQPFNPLGITSFASMHFELLRGGENLRVNPVIMATDGTRFFIHKLIKAMNEDRSGYVRAKLRAFKWPVSWEMLCRYYSNGPANIQFSDAQRQLPPLIDYHFDLIQNSENVVNVHSRKPHIGIEVSTGNDNTFQITLIADGHRVSINETSRQQAINIRIIGKMLDIETYADDCLATMRNMLQDAKESFPNAQLKNGILSFPANAQSAHSLSIFWKIIPQDIEKLHTRRVAGLLEEKQHDTFVDISLQDNGRFTNVSFHCTSNGYAIPDYAIKSSSSNYGIFQNSSGDWMHFDYDKIAAAMQALAQEGFDGHSTTILRQSAAPVISRLESTPNIRVADNSLLLLNSIRSEVPPKELKLTQALVPILRPYQKIGFDFLAERVRYGVGSILADDMGLGKTLQVLSIIEACKQNALSQNERFRALVVAPASVIDVWLKQAAQFCPQMSCEALRGAKTVRLNILKQSQAAVLVTHYGLVRSDIAELSQLDFSIIVLDEAQAIKNPGAAVTSAVRSLKSQRRLALTGTPLENNLGDLWSILDFLNPGINGELADFQLSFSTSAGRSKIANLLKLLMLRRSKALVAPELPPKTEEIIRLDMDDEFEKLYARELAKAKMSGATADMATILSLYTRLRLLCCAPELIMKDNPQNAPASIKINFLKEKLQELTEAGHSVLVFSQFTAMLAILERELSANKTKWFKITGDTPIGKRSQIVEDFNNSQEASVFLLSLKAAGTGLTLTRADYVFLADPWWNPAIENQAIDRTHRIGQDKPVFAYRIIMANSIEEKVLNIIQYKRELFSAVIDGVDAGGSNKSLTLEELRGLLNN